MRYHLIMPGRGIPLITGGFYHVFNRGVAKLPTFISQQDYYQAILGLNYYRFVKPPIKLSRFKKLSYKSKVQLLETLSVGENKFVDILSYVLMSNHFHLLLKQNVDNGITKYLSLFTNSYTRYFNTKANRPGPIFQGVFKAVQIESNDQFLHLSRYIHLNPHVSGIVNKEELLTYPWSSLPSYLSGSNDLVDIDPIISQFKNTLDYQCFILDHSDYARELELIKHLTIDVE